MHRAETKKAEKRKATRRLLAVCIPLCLCTVLLGLTALSHNFRMSEDASPPVTGDTCGEADEPSEAVIYRNGSYYPVEDADAFYEAVLTLFETNITTADGADLENGSVGGVPNGGSSPESFYEDGNDGSLNEKSDPCTLIFRRPDGDHEFVLKDGVLTDLNTKESISVTPDQEAALLNGDIPV